MFSKLTVATIRPRQSDFRMSAFTELPAGESVNFCNGLPKQHVQKGSSSNGSAPLQISRLTAQESTPVYYPQDSITISFPTHRPGRATDLPPIVGHDSAFCRQLTIHTIITRPNSARTKEAAHRIGTLTKIITLSRSLISSSPQGPPNSSSPASMTRFFTPHTQSQMLSVRFSASAWLR